MLVDPVPRGHRHWQLARALELLAPDAGRLLDLGAGSGWLSTAWPGPAVALDVFAPRAPDVPWVAGTTVALPFVDESFDAVALLASLGAFRERADVVGALSEVARVLRPGGRVVALASARRLLLDAVAPHRVRTGWRWRSFPPELLLAAFDAAGLRVEREERRGGVRSLAVDWAVTVCGPVLRRSGGAAALERLGELDAADFAAVDPRGRYLYVSAVRR